MKIKARTVPPTKTTSTPVFPFSKKAVAPTFAICNPPNHANNTAAIANADLKRFCRHRLRADEPPVLKMAESPINHVCWDSSNTGVKTAIERIKKRIQRGVIPSFEKKFPMAVI